MTKKYRYAHVLEYHDLIILGKLVIFSLSAKISVLAKDAMRAMKICTWRCLSLQADHRTERD